MTAPVSWNDHAMPLGIGLDQLLYQVRRTDDGLIYDSVTLQDLTEGCEALALDALVTPYAKLDRKVRQLQAVMARSVPDLGVEAVQVSDPFKQNGTANVVALFELSDGQTVSIYFHNPDATPGKILPTDELISWKWLLNKKDITIVVAPERGSDLAIREVGRRIMKLAAKNTAAFARVNARRAERLQNIASLRSEVEGLERELDGVMREIEVARLEAEERALKPAAVEPGPATPEEGLAALNSVRQFLSRGQYRTIADAMRGEEGGFFIDKAKLLAQLIDGMAKTYEQDGKGDDAIAYLHYFKGAADWHITEKDASGKGTEQAFGLADLGQGGELGYISIDELVRNNVELDLHFDPKVLSAVRKVEPEPEPEQPAEPEQLGEPSAEEAERIQRLLSMLGSARGQLATMQPGSGFYGNLQSDIADMASQLWRLGYRGPEVAEPAPVEPVEPEAAAVEPPAEVVTPDENPLIITPEGIANTVKTAKGTKVETGFTVIEADRLIASHDADGNANPEYPQIIQPRDRGRDSSIAWVKKTASQLDPDSLGRTSRADSGAPIVGPDRVVESGNGRTMAIQEAYRAGTAEEYRVWLIDEAAFFGLDPERVRAMNAPVLVRVRTSSIDRRTFAVEANQDDKLSLTGTEKAKADADRLDMTLMAKLSDEGNLLAAANRDFVTGFLQSLGDTEAAQYMTTNGQPTGALIARIQAAIFAKAYNDDRLLELTADSSRPEVANVLEALNVSAPEFILAQAADAAGTQALTGQLVDSVQTSLNQQAIEAIIQATNLVRKARSEGGSVEEAINQLGLFGDIPPATAAMALFISKNNRSAKRLGVAFKAMAEFVRQEAERGQTVDMFGESQAASLQQILEAANRKLDQEYGEGAYAIEGMDLFTLPDLVPQQPAQAESDEDKLSQAAQETNTNPTEEEKESGDYQKGELSLYGLDIVIENPQGSERSGTSQDGDAWSVTMQTHYGFIKGTKGADGDEVDVFIGPDLQSEVVFVVEQVGKEGEFDEYKGMLGFTSESDARSAYLGSFKPDWDGLGSIRTMSIDEFKTWVAGAASSAPPASAEPQQMPPQAAQESPALTEDREFLESILNNTVPDILAPELGDQIGAVYERNADDAHMLSLIEQAVMAYQRAMEQATASL